MQKTEEKCKFSQKNILLEIPRYKSIYDKEQSERNKQNKEETNNQTLHKGRTDYPIQKEPLGLLRHYQEQWTTHIYYDIPETKNNSKEDKNNHILHRVMTYFQNYNMNASYVKKFSQIKNQNSPEALKSTITYTTYMNFVSECLENIYYKIYFSTKKWEEFKDSSEYRKIKNDLDYDYKNGENFVNGQNINEVNIQNKTMLAAIAINEVCDKITDGEIYNAFILLSNVMSHPINNLLSTAAVSVAFFNYKLSKLKKKEGEDLIFSSKAQLPKITFIAFEGFYSEITIDFLLQFTENIQIIMIYDSQTGGPNILYSNYGSVPDYDYRSEKLPKNLNEKILYLPLECKDSKTYFSEDFLNLFDNMVLPAIRKFKPELIVMSHSFNFTRNNKTPFHIDEKTFSQIIYNLCLACNYKLIVFPFKLYGDVLQSFTTKEGLNDDRIKYLKDKFVEEYDRKYLMNCFVNTLETLAGIKVHKKIYSRSRNLKYFNIDYTKNLKALQKHYKTHSNYYYLYVKDYGISDLKIPYILTHYEENKYDSKNDTEQAYVELDELRKIQERMREQNDDNIKNEIFAEEWMKIVRDANTKNSKNSIYLFNEQLEPLEYKLYFTDTGRNLPVVYNDDTQYIVDYQDKNLFLFNVRTSLGYKHFSFKFDSTNRKLIGTIINQNPDLPNNVNIFKMGLCMIHNDLEKSDQNVYLFYGISYDVNSEINDIEGKEVNYIQAYNVRSRKWRIINIKGDTKPIARHSVTAFSLRTSDDDRTYAYAFGGEINDESRIQGGQLYNIVDFYKISKDSDNWEYVPISKSTLTSNQKPYIPYLGSFVFQSSRSELIIFGGKRFEFSENERTYNIFNLNLGQMLPSEQSITNHKLYMLPPGAPNIADFSKNYRKTPDEHVLMIIPHGNSHYGLAKFNLEQESLEYKIIEKSTDIFVETEKTKLPKTFFWREHDKADYSIDSSISISLAQTYLIKYYFNTMSKKEALFRVLFNCFEKNRENTINKDKVIDIIKEYGKNYDGTENLDNVITDFFTKYEEAEKLFTTPGTTTLYVLQVLANEIETDNIRFKEDREKLYLRSGKQPMNNKEQITQKFTSAQSMSMINNPLSEAPKTRGVGAGLSEGTNYQILNKSIGSILPYDGKNPLSSNVNQQMISENPMANNDQIYLRDQGIPQQVLIEKSGTLQKPDSSVVEQPQFPKLYDNTPIQQPLIQQPLIQQQLQQQAQQPQKLFNQLPPQFQQPQQQLQNPQSYIMNQNLVMQNGNNLEAAGAVPTKMIDFNKVHSYNDFYNAYKSDKLDNFHIITNYPFNTLFMYDDKLELKTKFKLMIKVKDDYENIGFVEETSDAFAIHGSAFVCFIGMNFSDRYPNIYSEYKNCLLYGNLEDTNNKDDNQKERLIILGKLCDSESENLFNRIMLADSSCIYLLGGLTLHLKKKNPIKLEDKFIKYDISQNSIKASKNLGFHQNLKKQGTYLFQSSDKIYSLYINGDKYQMTIFDKSSEEWDEDESYPKDLILDSKDKLDFYKIHFVNYNFKDGPGILVIGYHKLKPMYFAKLTETENNYKLQKLKIQDGSLDVYYYTGYESLPIQRSTRPWTKILMRNARECPAVIDEIKIID